MTEIKITADQAAAARAGGKVAESFTKEFASSVKSAMDREDITDVLQSRMSEGAKVDKTGFQRHIEDVLKTTTRNTRVRRASELLGEKVHKSAFAWVKNIPTSIKKQISKIKPERGLGLISQLLWGKAGREGTIKGLKDTNRAIASSIMQTITRPLGMGLGQAPRNIAALGLGGGAALTGAMALGGLFTGGLTYGFRREAAQLQLAPLMGRGGRPGFGAVDKILEQGRAAGFDIGETLGIAAPLARGGAGGAVGATLKGQRAFQMGPQLTQMFTAMAQQGVGLGMGAKGAARSEESAKRVIAAGVGTGLAQGRWGEIATGMARMMLSGGIGLRVTEPGVMEGLQSVSRAFKGEQAFQALRGMEALARTPQTMLGRAISLQTIGGLGRPGAEAYPGVGDLPVTGQERARRQAGRGDIFAAERIMELGLFGEFKMPTGEVRQGAGIKGFKSILDRFQEVFGLAGRKVGEAQPEFEREVARGMMLKELGRNMGITATATEALIQSVEMGNVTGDELRKKMADILKRGKPLQDKAFAAMIEMAQWKGLRAELNRTFATFFQEMSKILPDILNVIREVLRWVQKYIQHPDQTALGQGQNYILETAKNMLGLGEASRVEERLEMTGAQRPSLLVTALGKLKGRQLGIQEKRTRAILQSVLGGVSPEAGTLAPEIAYLGTGRGPGEAYRQKAKAGFLAPGVFPERGLFDKPFLTVEDIKQVLFYLRAIAVQTGQPPLVNVEVSAPVDVSANTGSSIVSGGIQ